MESNQHQERLEEKQKFARQRAVKSMTKIALIVIIIVGGIGSFVWYLASRPSIPEGEVISRSGIHWHPELKIIIKGEAITIPANIGIGMQYAGYPRYDPMMMMTDMHTHDSSGILHWEVMKGPVKKEDVRLDTFFSIWGKKFSDSCIFEYCNGTEGLLKFIVNGKENLDFENYLVKDKDKIEIIFE